MKSKLHVEKDKLYHNEIAVEYDKVVVKPRQYTNNLIYSIIKKKLNKKYLNGLDLGCGTGHMSKRFGKHVRFMDAVDNSEEMIKIAKKNLSKFGDIRFFVKDYKDFFRQNKKEYQIIFCTGFIHHLLLEEREKLIKELYKSLAPGGVLLLSEPIQLEGSAPEEIKTWNDEAVKYLANYSKKINEPDEIPLNRELFIKKLIKNGFRLVYTLQSWEIFPCNVSYIYNTLKIRQYFYKYLGSGNVLTILAKK